LASERLDGVGEEAVANRGTLSMADVAEGFRAPRSRDVERGVALEMYEFGTRAPEPDRDRLKSIATGWERETGRCSDEPESFVCEDRCGICEVFRDISDDAPGSERDVDVTVLSSLPPRSGAGGCGAMRSGEAM